MRLLIIQDGYLPCLQYFSTIFMSTERVSLRIILRTLRAKGFNVQHILVIGAGELGERFAKKINKNFYIGYNIIGFLDDNIPQGHKIGDSRIIGSIKDLEHIILTNNHGYGNYNHICKALCT